MVIPVEGKDLTLTTPWGLFNHRAGCLVFKDNQVLLEKAIGDDGFWFTPGGRIKFQENSKDTVAREIEEELFVKPVSIDLAAILENFFCFRGKDFHEVCFYYRVTLPESFVLPTKDKDGNPALFEWHKLDILLELDIKPNFFKSRMDEFKTGVTHILHDDRA